jgi:hypothetical protein
VVVVATSTATPTPSTPTRRSRRAGYVASVVVNLLLLIAINVRPGWSAVPFLTDATALVIPVVNLSLVAGTVANLIYAINDPPLVRSLGDCITTTIAFVVVVRLWQVFPFDVSDGWQIVFRVGLLVVGFGCAIGAVVCLIRFIGCLVGKPR